MKEDQEIPRVFNFLFCKARMRETKETVLLLEHFVINIVLYERKTNGELNHDPVISKAKAKFVNDL